jgi:hypothetical protein
VLKKYFFLSVSQATALNAPIEQVDPDVEHPTELIATFEKHRTARGQVLQLTSSINPWDHVAQKVVDASSPSDSIQPIPTTNETITMEETTKLNSVVSRNR